MSSNQFNKGPSYGLSAEVRNRLAQKYDPQKEAELRVWIENLTGRQIGPDFQKGLKDGVILCELINKLQPGSIRKINTSSLNWHQLENLSNFIKSLLSYGLKPVDLFEANDLYESGNMTQVQVSLLALAGMAKTKGIESGMDIGVKYSEKRASVCLLLPECWISDRCVVMLHFYTILLGFFILVPLLANIFLPYLWLDLRFFFSLLWTGYRSQKRLQRNPPFTLLDCFLDKVLKHPEKPFILFEDEIYSYHDIDRLSNQMARVLKGYVKLKEGETMAVFLKNIPAYIWVWMGLEKIGCTMACINYNIRLKSLLHVLKTCNAKVLLTTPDFKDAIEDVLPDLKDEGLQVFYLSDDSPSDGIEALLGQVKLSSDEPVPASYRANITDKSISVYIFTSGTTGLPKAAIINQAKLLMIANIFILCDINAKDIIYTPLPLYHSAALLIGIGGCLEVGATCVLGPKFSVSNFWKDCKRYQVSVIQYVGETMRYLCNAPKKDNDRDHCVRKAIGNGMKREVWKEFLRRFGCLKVYEFYGATEGNLGFINYIGKVGAVGKINFLYKKLAKFELIQYDVDQNEVVRNEKGYCVPVAPGETGLLVGKITMKTPFYGYAGDHEKTKKKLLQDVMEKGDSYFNSGDLLMQDQDGFIYFQDRVGDTFRWKGENVATTEVETILVMLKFIQEANVYGVPVPGHEGKIGMAAIRLKEGESFDGKQLYEHTKNYLPNYAIPHFIRIQEALEITGTFKQCKTQLVKEEFDPITITEPLFFLDNSEKNFVPLTLEIYHSITEKKRKL